MDCPLGKVKNMRSLWLQYISFSYWLVAGASFELINYATTLVNTRHFTLISEPVADIKMKSDKIFSISTGHMEQ